MRFELLDFLERARVDDGGGDVVRENPQPGGGMIRGRNAVELRDDTQSFVLKNDRLPAEPANALAAGPSPLAESVHLLAGVVADHRLARGGNPANRPNADGNPPQFLLRFRLSRRRPGAGDQVQAAGLVWTPGTHGAGGAKIALLQQPEPRQHGVRTFRQPLHDLAQQALHRTFGSNLQQEIPQRIELRFIVRPQLHGHRPRYSQPTASTGQHSTYIVNLFAGFAIWAGPFFAAIEKTRIRNSSSRMFQVANYRRPGARAFLRCIWLQHNVLHSNSICKSGWHVSCVRSS